MEWWGYLVTALGAGFGVVGTLISTRGTTRQSDTRVTMNTLMKLVQESKEEINQLKAEVMKLTDENIELKLEICSLREQLIREGVHCEKVSE